IVALTRMTVALVPAAAASRAACVVTVTVVPPAPPVVPAAKPSAVFDQFPGSLPPPTWVNSHCMREMSEQVSCTTGLLPAVDPSRLLTHRPETPLVTRNLPDAAPDAANDHCCGAFVPSPQPHC